MKTKNKNIVTILIALIAGLLLGWLFFGGNGNTSAAVHEHSAIGSVQWTCSMHPEIRSSEEGDCPICGMELIPVGDEESLNGDIFQMTEDAMKLANIQTMRVGSDMASKEMRLNGKVVADERKTFSQSTHIPGRIEELRINFTGERITRGQTLAVIYSPELITAQEELLQAYKIREQQPELYSAVWEKLRNWRISENLLDRILNSGEPLQSFPITADVSGVITEKLVDLGDYVERGMPLYTVSDLSKVWVLFDLYESQLALVKEGSSIEFSIASLPGETFKGKITFIDPILNNQTRVATARVEVDNSDGRLKPEMFASGVLRSAIGEGDSEEIVVPKTAVLWTGKRSLVYIKEELGGKVGFQLREVLLGPSLGDSYVIEEGLSEGEEIVVNGTFTVDAAVQLSGRASMMNPDKGGYDASRIPSQDIKEFLEINSEASKKELTPVFQVELNNLLNSYLEVKESLVEANDANSVVLLREFLDILKNMEAQEIPSEVQNNWNDRQEALEASVEKAIAAEILEDRRQEFISLSEEMIRTIADYGSENRTIFVNYCPMANSDQGAYWLSEMKEIRNPYYGQAMLGCGEIVKEIN